MILAVARLHFVLKASLATVIAAIALGTMAVPAHATIELPADDGNVAFPTGITGEFAAGGLADVGSLTSGTTDVAAAGGCPGCHALHHMYWTNYGLYEYVGIKEVHAIAEVAIDRITAHAALIHGTGDCYDGDYYWTGTFDQNNTKGWTRKNTPKWGTGYNDTYTLAGGRNWYEAGVKYSPVGGQPSIDICKKF